jgi:hypothetical protein
VEERKRERGGGRPKGWGSEREGAARVKGGGELMGSPPPDRDPWPKLALTSAPDPTHKSNKYSTVFLVNAS